ncbi:MAG TPA: proteobacterial dedicated sortase system response regulator [Gammaproteobacteria bacterium]|nr:proteobacterial dedicated sortase system response regulator [Gammaproteobacteria bacterium]
MQKTIAIVEDEPSIRANYADALGRHGYQVNAYPDRPTAQAAFRKKLPDLVLLDIGLEDEIDAGFELCRELRGLSTTLPIIFLTARDSDFDTVAGLRLGADDYLSKDTSLPHLTARISALFRRLDALDQANNDMDNNEIIRGNLCVDLNKFSIAWKSRQLNFTLTEFWIVHALAKHPGHVKNREQLMQDANIVVDDNTITSHIKRIRKKFESIDEQFSSIDTVYGIGYRWNE